MYQVPLCKTVWKLSNILINMEHEMQLALQFTTTTAEGKAALFRLLSRDDFHASPRTAALVVYKAGVSKEMQEHALSEALTVAALDNGFIHNDAADDENDDEDEDDE